MRLLQKNKIENLILTNNIVMAPMTRARGDSAKWLSCQKDDRMCQHEFGNQINRSLKLISRLTKTYYL